jgi:L-iditol 2-dehydrogenase
VTTRQAPAVRLIGVGRLEQSSVEVGEPGPDEVLLRVLSVGLCGSDAHWFEEGGIGDATVPEGGVIPGHEFCGVIESGPRSGERVAVDPAIPCLRCVQCQAGRLHLCLEMRFAGHGLTDGAMRSHLVWPERCLVTLPDDMPDEQGALLEPLGVALHAIDLGVVGAADRTAVIGCGPVGLLLVAALAARGVPDILALDPLEHRVAAATAMGATAGGSPTHDDEVDVVFDCAGNDGSLHTALQMARPGGRAVLVGVPEGDRATFQASLARRKEIALLLCRRMLPEDLARAAELVDSGAVSLDGLISHRFPMAEADTAFQTLVGRTGLKVVVQP